MTFPKGGGVVLGDEHNKPETQVKGPKTAKYKSNYKSATIKYSVRSTVGPIEMMLM